MRSNAAQVKALEKNFHVENKLEPDRKVKLAQELGLQPRQGSKTVELDGKLNNCRRTN